MAKDNKKTQKNMKASKKGKVIAILVCTVLALSAIAYIVYFTGLLPKVVPGVKITKTVNEQTSVIENISVLEVNYHTRQVMASYNINYEMWDVVYDATTGKTYGDLILDVAAEEIKDCVVVNEAAKANGYDDHGGAARYAELMLGNATSYAQYSRMTNDQYLSSIYGVGMTSRLFKQFTERMALTSEYESYVQQFVNVPTEADIQAEFDSDPANYQKADFSYKFFQVDEENDYTIEDAQADADKVISAVEKADEPTKEVFAGAIIDIIGADAPEIQYFSGEVPYFYEGYVKSLNYIAPSVSEFIFDANTENGSATTITTDEGVYVVMLVDKHVDETTTVAYRTCTLYLAANGGDIQPATELANSIVATPVDALGFDKVIKENSIYANEILTGGYYSGITADSFEGTDEQPATDEQKQLGQWLFDSSRKPGDMIVIAPADQSMVRVVFFDGSMPKWQQSCYTKIAADRTLQWRNDLFTEGQSYEISAELIDKLTYGNR